MQHTQELQGRWNGWLTDAKKRVDPLEALWLLTKAHINVFTTTASEFGKEKVAKKLGELKPATNKQQACLLYIITEIAIRAKEQTLSVKWALDLIYLYIDSKVPKCSLPPLFCIAIYFDY
jgi:hypothetical protein